MKVILGVALIAGLAVATFVSGGAALFGAAALIGSMGEAVVGAAMVGVLAMGTSLISGGIADLLYHTPGSAIASRNALAPWQVIYGQQMVGGTVIDIGESGGSAGTKYLHMVIVTACHQTQSFDGLWLDGRQVFFSGDPMFGANDDNGRHLDLSGASYTFRGRVFCQAFLGSPTQSACADYVSKSDGHWTVNHKVSGRSYIYLRLTYDTSVFPSGPPQVKSLWHGKTDIILDTVTGTRGYTTNAALCVADFLQNQDYGFRCSPSEINQPVLQAAANVCGTNTLTNTIEKQYELNGVFNLAATPGEILNNMLSAMGGQISYNGGQFNIYAATWRGASVAIDESNLLGPIKYLPMRKKRDLYNNVRGTFLSPFGPITTRGAGVTRGQINPWDGEWQYTDIPMYAEDVQHGYTSDVYYTADGEGLALNTKFPFTTSVAGTQRLAKIMLERNRQQGTGTLQCSLACYAIQPLDIVAFTYPRFGWTNKQFEVTATRLTIKSDGDKPPVPVYEIDIAETDIKVFGWRAGEELALSGQAGPMLPDREIPGVVLPVVMHSGSDTAVIGADGLQRSRILVTWGAVQSGFVTSGGKLIVQLQQTSGAGWNATTGPLSTIYLHGADTQCYFDNVFDGQSYTLQIAAVSVANIYSSWVAAGPHVVSNSVSVFSSNNVTYPNGETVTSLKPAQAGADVTHLNTSNDTNQVGGTASTIVLTDITNAQGTATTANNTANTVTADVAHVNSVDYLVNADKIALIAQWAAEAAMKSSLDSLASTWVVSSTFYDNAVAAISTSLITAGAPVNWATIWPNGATSGPWTGIKTNLGNLWAQVETQRTGLQSTISSYQASAAQTAAVSAAATDATTKMNTAITAAAGAPIIVNGLPTLPNATYPANKLVYDTVTKALYMSTGSVWQPSTVGAANIQGTITDAQVAALAASKVTGLLSDTQLAAISAAKLLGVIPYVNNSDVVTGAINSSGQVLNVNGTVSSTVLANITAANTAASVADGKAVTANAAAATANTAAGTAQAAAVAAQGTATTATTNAATAQTTANTANTAAGVANTAAGTAQAAAVAAQTTANTANTAAGTAQTTANTANTAAGTAQTAANTANTAIGNITSDNVLSMGEKPQVVLDWNVINSEYPGILAQGTSYALSTATFTTAYNTLSAYLLAIPGGYSVLTVDSVVVGTTFRTNWASYYSEKQLLLNAIVAAAKVLAGTAQTTANTANTAAGTATTNAATAQTTANTANTAAGVANTAAGTAQTTANTANTAAGVANTAAGTAQTTANTANTAAGVANTAAGVADGKAVAAQTTGNNLISGTATAGKIDFSSGLHANKGALATVSQITPASASTYIAASTITGTLIAATTITAANIVGDTITANQIAANAITSLELAAGAVIAGKITAGTIVAADIAASTITGAKIAATTITAANIVADTITATQIAASAITSSELAAGAVIAGKITAGTIVAGDIAASTITGDKIAANTITAANILADTITAGQIAAGAIGASEIAAGSITTAALTVANFDNLIPNPNSAQAAPVGGWPAGAYESAGLINGTLFAGAPNSREIHNATVAISPLIPVSIGDQYYMQGNAVCETPGTAYIAAAAFSASGTNLGWAGIASTTATSGQPLLSFSCTIPSTIGGGTPVSIQFMLISNSSADFNNFYARRMADANLLVDGCITTAKIVAGGISANVITTGTLNAATVAVTNLNASNITTGVLSATKVQFGDGSALTTASRVLTATAVIPSDAEITCVYPSPAVWVNTGIGFSVVASSGADTYNIYAILASVVLGGTNPISYSWNVAVIVDGNTASPLVSHPITLQIPASNSTPIMSTYIAALSGLSAGAHTVNIYVKSHNLTNLTVNKDGSYAACQRIY